jgi:uncharacterized membrane protein (Fun14 family)
MNDRAQQRRRLPRWGLVLLIGAVLLAAVGVTLRATTPPPGESATQAYNGVTGMGFLSRDDSPAPPPEPTSLTWQERLHEHSPTLIRVGMTFAVGFAIGFAFRSFLKTAATIAAVAVVGMLLLSWSGVLHLDMATMQERYRDTTAWLVGETQRLFDTAFTYVPSALAGLAGGITGFLRR